MATMATTSWSLSTPVSEFVARPSPTSKTNPMDQENEDSTLGAHFADEHANTNSGFPVSDCQLEADSTKKISETDDYEGGLRKSELVPSTLEDVETRLKRMTEEQFYVKFRLLQEANRKTLEVCEQICKADKVTGGCSMVDENVSSSPYLADSVTRHEKNTPKQLQINGWMNNECSKEKVIVTAKPPPSPQRKRENSLSKSVPNQGIVLPENSTAPISFPTSTLSQSRRAYSLDDEEWYKVMQMPKSTKPRDEVNSDGRIEPELLASVSKIRNMWQGFKIDDYCSDSSHKKSSSSLPRKNKRKESKQNRVKEWHHRVTVPEPFSMSLREANKTEVKTRAQRELEQLRYQKQQEEEKECKKQFKAQPAPAHIYQPLFNEIQEKKETRRRHMKQYGKDILKIQQKPFSFIKRDEEKKRLQTASSALAETKPVHSNANSVQKAKKKQKFIAQPVPDFVTSNSPRQKYLEEEEYRKMRIKMRSEEMLRKSSLPPNMAATEQMKKQRAKEREKNMKNKKMKSKQKHRTKRRARSAGGLPDFDALHQEIQKELAFRKSAKEATVMEPFFFEKDQRWHDMHAQVLEEIEREERMREELREATRAASLLNTNTGRPVSSLDSLHQKSAELCSAYFRWLTEHEAKKKDQQEEIERRKRIREEKIQKYISEQGNYMPEMSQLMGHRESDSLYLQQYERDLEELRERMEKRQLLLELELQDADRKAAPHKTKRPKSCLKKTDLDEDMLWTRDRTPFVTSRDCGDDEDERETGLNITFTKSRFKEVDRAS